MKTNLIINKINKHILIKIIKRKNKNESKLCLLLFLFCFCCSFVRSFVRWLSSPLTSNNVSDFIIQVNNKKRVDVSILFLCRCCCCLLRRNDSTLVS